MAVAVESELRATRPLIPDIPKHGCPVLLIELIPRVNEEKTAVLLLRIFLPEDAYYMNAALYPRFHPPFQLCCPRGGL